MAKRFNIRMAGVGGQGVVTGSHILSTAVINAGGESTIVPFYGSEKRMAPVESYVRVSDEPIYEIGEITFPHIIIIFHPQVITHGKSYTMPFYFGLKEDGVCLINNDGPMKLHRDQAAELQERRATHVLSPGNQSLPRSRRNGSSHEHGVDGSYRLYYGSYDDRSAFAGRERPFPWERLCSVRRNGRSG